MTKKDVPLPSAGASVSLTSQIMAAARKPAVWLPAAIAFVLLLSTVNSGLIRDDYLHRALLLGEQTFPGMPQEQAYSLSESAQKLFSFFTEDNQLLAHMKYYGNAPWWADDDLTLGFWRPVAGITHWIDYQLWPDSPVMMHLHSQVWYVILGLLLGAWLVQLGVGRLALWLVMLFYMLDASHLHAIAWPANRNILIASAFGVLSMMALTQYAHNNKSGYLVLSLVTFLVALLSAEAGISFLGIVIAFLLMLDSRSVGLRIGILGAFLLVVSLWRMVYSSLGYGATHSGFYVDPLGDTVNFIETLLLNGPIMLYEQLVRIPSLSMLMSPQVEVHQAMISLLVLLISAAIFSPLLLRNRLATFGFFTAVIALPPACATIVSGGRLMFIFGIGMSLIMGLWFAGLRQEADWFATKPKWYRGLAWIWSGILMLTILLGTGAVWGTKIVSSFSGEKEPFLVHTNVIEDVREDQTLVLINPPVLFDHMYMPLKADYFDMPFPKSMVSLVPGFTDFSIRLENPSTLVLENPKGFLISPESSWYQARAPQSHVVYLAKRADRFFTSNHKRPDFSISQELAGATVTVLETNAQDDPTRIRFGFRQPLFSDHHVVLLWDWSNNKYLRIEELGSNKVKGPF